MGFLQKGTKGTKIEIARLIHPITAYDIAKHMEIQPEEFMREYFRERTERVRDMIARHQPFRKKYYTEDCHFDSHKKEIEWSEQEKILEMIPANNGEVRVITIKPPIAQYQQRMRYHLKASGNTWQIFAAEYECLICKGTGKRKNGTHDCPLCKGNGWKDYGAE